MQQLWLSRKDSLPLSRTREAWESSSSQHNRRNCMFRSNPAFHHHWDIFYLLLLIFKLNMQNKDDPYLFFHTFLRNVPNRYFIDLMVNTWIKQQELLVAKSDGQKLRLWWSCSSWDYKVTQLRCGYSQYLQAVIMKKHFTVKYYRRSILILVIILSY